MISNIIIPVKIKISLINIIELSIMSTNWDVSTRMSLVIFELLFVLIIS